MNLTILIAIPIIIGLLLLSQPLEALHGLGGLLFFFGSISALGFIAQRADD